MKGQKKQPTKEQALIRLEALCARSEQCTADILTKLRRMHLSSDDIAGIIESLKKRKFIDDSRFAASFVNDKYKFAKWGRRKIRMALARKQIFGAAADEALETIDDEIYHDILTGIMKVKARSITEGNTFEGRTKLFRFAASRGYEPDLIAGVIRQRNLWEAP